MQLRLELEQNVSQSGCGGMRKPATKKKSSDTTASSLSGSGSISVPGTQPSPSMKYPFSTISLILPMVMIDNLK
jgi:hypothetical protein